jgi:hypothetical protein
MTMMSFEPLNEQGRQRLRRRNWAVFLVLAALAALVYAITLVKIRQGYG